MDLRRVTTARDFVDLARRKSAERRDTLIGNVADLFLDPRARLSDRERALMTGILRTLIGEIEREVRDAVAARLAEKPDIVDVLAGEAEIARPLLMRGDALRSAVLIDAIKTRCREHRLSAAVQPGLSAEIAEAPGPADDIETLLQDATGDAGRLAGAYLVAEAERVDRRLMPRLPRAELPAEVVRLLFWAVAAALRAHLLNRFTIDPRVLDDAVEAATRELLDRQPTAAEPPVEAAARAVVESLSAAGPLEPAALIRLLRAGHAAAFLAGLALACKVQPGVIRRIVLDGDGVSLALLCRACGFPGDAFAELLGTVHRALADTARLPADTRDSILAFYDRMTVENASAALAYWRREPEFAAAIDRVAAAAIEPPASD